MLRSAPFSGKKPGDWWGTLYIVSIALFMDALDAALVNVALPGIQQSC